MKNIALLILLFLATAVNAGNGEYILTGKIHGTDNGTVYLQKSVQGSWITFDSTRIRSGIFMFRGMIGQPEMMQVSMPEKEVTFSFFLDKTPMRVDLFPDNPEKNTVKGSPANDLYMKWVGIDDSLSAKIDSVYTLWKKAREIKDSVEMDRLDIVNGELESEVKKSLSGFVHAHRASVVSPYLVMRNSWQFELPELEEITGFLDTALRSSGYTKALLKRVDILRSVAVGKIAPDFSMADSTGKMVRLSELKGGYLLVDFWASWCGPCRAENPHVVKAFQAYHGKGFNILGCSFDQKRDKWLKAVHDDGLTWLHVSDLKGWGNEAGKLYGVNSIPANVLLDPDHRIIARNLRGEELMKKLEEIFGSH